MKLKTGLNLTALLLFMISVAFPAQADTQKMYGIRGIIFLSQLKCLHQGLIQ